MQRATAIAMATSLTNAVSVVAMASRKGLAIAMATSLMNAVSVVAMALPRATAIAMATSLTSVVCAVATASPRAIAIATATKRMRSVSAEVLVLLISMPMASVTTWTTALASLMHVASATAQVTSTIVGVPTSQKGIATVMEIRSTPLGCAVGAVKKMSMPMECATKRSPLVAPFQWHATTTQTPFLMTALVISLHVWPLVAMTQTPATLILTQNSTTEAAPTPHSPTIAMMSV